MQKCQGSISVEHVDNLPIAASLFTEKHFLTCETTLIFYQTIHNLNLLENLLYIFIFFAILI